MQKLFHATATVLERPEIQVLLGLCLVLSGGLEIVEDLVSDEPATLGAHHGVAVFGIAHTLRQIPELAEGVSKLLWGIEVGAEAEDDSGSKAA